VPLGLEGGFLENRICLRVVAKKDRCGAFDEKRRRSPGGTAA
jgi:hypothetical protein